MTPRDNDFNGYSGYDSDEYNEDSFLDNYREDDDDGVVLELSSDARRRPDERAGNRRPTNRDSERRRSIDEFNRNRGTRRPDVRQGYSEYDERPRRRSAAPKKSKLVYFYIFTLLAGVIVCVALFAIFFTSFMKRYNPVEGYGASPTPSPIPIASQELRQTFGMIADIDTHSSPRTIKIFEITSNRTNTYELQDGTLFRDRYGTDRTQSELRVGMIINIGYDAQSLTVSSITENVQAWELSNKININFDLENGTVTLGNDTYNFSGSQTLVRYKGEPYPLGQITAMDTVSLVGYENNVWFVRAEKIHGYIAFEQEDKIINGNITIDSSIFKNLDDIKDPIPLVEGTHRVVVEGDNIEIFMVDVNIRPGETYVLNLIDIDLRMARLFITTSERDATIIVNGEPITEPGPAEVEYGDHLVRVEKDGFIPVEQTVTVANPTHDFHIEMKRIALPAKAIIYTYPSGGEIYIDGVFAGYSPLTKDLETGIINVTVKLQGHNDFILDDWELIEGDNSRTLILTATGNPLELPPPDYTQPVVPITPEPTPQSTPDPWNITTPNASPDPWNINTPTASPDPWNITMPTASPDPLNFTTPTF